MSDHWAIHSIEDTAGVSAGEKKIITFAIPADVRVRFIVIAWGSDDSIGHGVDVQAKFQTRADVVVLGNGTLPALGSIFAMPPAVGFQGDFDGGIIEVAGPVDILFADKTPQADAGPLMQPVLITWLEKTGPADNGITPTTVVS